MIIIKGILLEKQWLKVINRIPHPKAIINVKKAAIINLFMLINAWFLRFFNKNCDWFVSLGIHSFKWDFENYDGHYSTHELIVMLFESLKREYLESGHLSWDLIRTWLSFLLKVYWFQNRQLATIIAIKNNIPIIKQKQSVHFL
jgi:hypothetical protein